MGQVYGYTLPTFPGGINLIDSVDAIPETDCIELENLYPLGSRCVLRGGLDLFSTPNAGQANKTLANYVTAAGADKLISGGNGKLQVESSGASEDISLAATTYALNEWQSTNFNGRIFLVNGTDTPQVYTGSGDAANTSFTGVTQTTLVNVATHKERLYFVQKDTASIWYGGLKAISGALTEFTVAYFLKRGGFIVSCGSTTRQTSTVSQDLFYILSSEGELLFYQGSSPADTAWSLVARFYIGKPLGYRAHVHVENDLWFITSQGVVPVSGLFSGGASVASNSISRKINPILQEAASSLSFSYMYSAKYWPQGRRVYISYPSTTTNTRYLVCNIETGAWTMYKYGFVGAALCMEISDDVPYVGASNGKVYTAESGFNDDDLPIYYRARGGANFFGKRGTFKKFVDIRPIIKTDASSLTIELDIDTNFQQRNNYATIATPFPDPGELSVWDVASWDTSDWSEEEVYLFGRYSLKGQGHCGALRIRGSIKDALLEFNAFEIRFEEGAQV